MVIHNRDLDRVEAAGNLDSVYTEMQERPREQERIERLRSLHLQLVAAREAQAIADADIGSRQELISHLCATPVDLWPPNAEEAASALLQGDTATPPIAFRAIWADRGNIFVAATYDRALSTRLRSIPGGRFSWRRKIWVYSGRSAHAALLAMLEEVENPGFQVNDAARRELRPSSGGTLDIVGVGTVWAVSLAYSPDAVEAVRRLQGARYDETTKTWSVPAAPATDQRVLALVEDLALDVSPAAAAALVDALPPAARKHLRAAASAATRAKEQLRSAARAGAGPLLLAEATERAQASYDAIELLNADD